MCTVYSNANYATLTFNTLNKISHQHVNDKKQIKLSKTEKMTCLIRPWKWNSINRSLKSKKCGCQEKRAKSHQSFYHNRKTQSLLYILHV